MYYLDDYLSASTDSNIISCNGYATSAKFTPNYAAPFKLSMTINTSTLHIGNGGIFSDRLNSSTVSISWLEDENSGVESKIKFVISNKKVSLTDGTRLTENLNKSKNYDLEVNYDGHFCNVLLDGAVIGDLIDCSSSFGEIGSPEICYADVEGKWIGKITNLELKSFGSKLFKLNFSSDYTTVF